jgi:hypothetical protein
VAVRELRFEDRRWIGPLMAQDDVRWLAVFNVHVSVHRKNILIHLYV